MYNKLHTPISIKAVSNGFCCLKHLSTQIFALIPASLIQSTLRPCKSPNLQLNLHKLTLITKWDYKMLWNKESGHSCKASQKHNLLQRKREVCLPVSAPHNIMSHFSSISTKGRVSFLSQLLNDSSVCLLSQEYLVHWDTYPHPGTLTFITETHSIYPKSNCSSFKAQ